MIPRPLGALDVEGMFVLVGSDSTWDSSPASIVSRVGTRLNVPARDVGLLGSSGACVDVGGAEPGLLSG